MNVIAIPPADVAGLVQQLTERGLMVLLVSGGNSATMPTLAPSVPATASPAFTAHTVKEAVLAALQSKQERGCRRSYLNSLSSTLNIFGESFGERPLHSITAGDVETWLSNPKWNNDTRRGYLKNIRTLMSWAVKRRWISRNVGFDLDMPMSTNKGPGILPVADAAKLMRACRTEDPGFVPWLAVQLFGGLRVCEACNLTPADVNGEFITIGADKAKTRRRRLVPINPTLRAWLDVAGPIDSVNWRKRVVKVRKAAGVKMPRNCLRHSFVSYSVPVHGAALTASWAGHSESVLFAHYRELVTPEQAAAFWKIMP